MNSLLQKYQNSITSRPVRTFIIQSSCLFTLGDVISQQLIEKKGFENHDYNRSLRMTIYGATIGGPVIGSWFGIINNAVKIKNKWKATVVRVGIDQMFFSPFILAVFMGGISLLEGRSMQEIKEKYQNSYFQGLMNSYRFWPFVNLFTFSCVPLHYRPLVNGCFGIAWNSYLSHLNQKSIQALHSTSSDHIYQ